MTAWEVLSNNLQPLSNPTDFFGVLLLKSGIGLEGDARDTFAALEFQSLKGRDDDVDDSSPEVAFSLRWFMADSVLDRC